MNQIKIGEFLKELRKEKGLTQEQLAEQFNVSRRSVSRWETGNNMPDLSMLITLAEYYEVDVKEIIDGKRKSENMNEEMKKQWKAKNADYFRELLFKKMSTEIQMAQQFVAQKMLERSMSINDMAMGKQASDHSGECEFQKLNDLREFAGTIDYLQKIANYKSIYENLIDFNSEDSMFKVSMTVSDWSGHLGQLDNDFITEKIAFIDLWDKDTLKRISPADIIKKLKVYFLPDKVAFVVNGMTISHLSLTSMYEEAVHKFYEKNKEYFKNVFLEKSCELEKQATFSNDEGSLLRNPDTSRLY